jgi:hypothetical protein
LTFAAEVAAEKNSTLVMPVPGDLLRFFDRTAPATDLTEPSAAAAQDEDEYAAAPPVPVLAASARLPADAALTAPFNAAPKVPAMA